MPETMVVPSLSAKSAAMPASPIRKLVPYSAAAKAAGAKVYHLNIGQPDIPSPEVALEAVRGISRKVIEYSDSDGFASYRNGLAEYYTAHGMAVRPEHIMVTTGGSEALIFGFMTAMDAGDEIIVPEPFYANYNGFATMGGMRVVPITATIDNGFALPPVEAFKERITPRTKAIVICNPGNPAGALYSRSDLEQLAGLAMEHGLYLFADEVYREFCYDGAAPFSCLNLAGAEQHVVMIDSVSKRYSMCGARVGALVTRNRAFLQAAMKFAQARLSPPTFGQIAAEAALRTPQAYFDAVKSDYVQRRNVLVDGLNSIPGVLCPKPAGAFYAMARLPIDDSDRFCQWMLESFRKDNSTVMMAPGTGFYSTPGLGRDEVRLAYVLETEELRKAIECLREGLAQYPGRSE